jgi:ATPase subunit of ABC transporter with duplicated ATPase domains
VPASLLARDVTVSFGPTTVLKDVGLLVDPGSRVGVIGPNGVGKSTFLRVLAGDLAPDEGTVQRRPPTATVGYLPQETDRRPGETLHALLARRTGVADAQAELDRTAEALGSGGDEQAYADALDRYLHLGGPDFDARAAATCDDLGLSTHLLDLGTEVLSGGQMARASLAGILLSRYDVFLLDEPTNDLDFDGLDRLVAPDETPDERPGRGRYGATHEARPGSAVRGDLPAGSDAAAHGRRAHRRLPA